MTKRMLIDTSHPEETRVVVLDGNRLEEFDTESAHRKPLKGNIYLGKVTRVEPSLQAAFVDYGGNRHGFLAFSEIHPDYYKIPIADRRALIAEEAELEASAKAEEEAEAEGQAEADDEAQAESVEDPETGDDEDQGESEADGTIETVGGDEIEQDRRRGARLRRQYKIQEVIKRRQILLIQVTKEERGNKGAALTSYLSLPGRFCVLMPNTARGGGISRKITNLKDRKRLKGIIDDLELPEEMAVILRTAGVERSKAEIKRDYEYLLRLWDGLRETTLDSTAPALIYEEADLIKRAIRDLYSRDIQEILVEGEDGYRSAKSLMRSLMPSHAKRVQLYKNGGLPMLHHYKVENQLDALHNPVVQLKSGGYIVINPTEALVAVDVNSGRSTRERNIEETALKTNSEAADEVARQIRLRDLAGLIVIDFIDMEERRNNGKVERRLKEAMRHDRARIQIGRISPLGLLELSRQRLRPSLFETSTQTCPVCRGLGIVRSTESTALHVLRALEDESLHKRTSEAILYLPTPVALYLLNQKRNALADIETRYGLRLFVDRDDSMTPPDFRIETTKRRTEKAAKKAVEVVEEQAAEVETVTEAAEEEPKPAKKRRRGRRGGRRRARKLEGETTTSESGEAETAEVETTEAGAEIVEAAEPVEVDASVEATEPIEIAEVPAKPRRRGRRRSTRKREAEAAVAETVESETEVKAELEAEAAKSEEDTEEEAKPKRKSRTRRTSTTRRPRARRKPKGEDAPATSADGADTVSDVPSPAEPAPEPISIAPEPSTEPEPLPMAARSGNGQEPATPLEAPPESSDEATDESKPRRRGWWNRLVE